VATDAVDQDQFLRVLGADLDRARFETAAAVPNFGAQ
jgi:hypothetical protein